MTRTRTTRYVTLLSFVLALALTAALAACGSDEPSGVTGPDRTASIPTETPASPTPTPTTPESEAAPTATVAPAAATAPLAASGSVETDREALVALYNATDGENWNQSDNWLSDAPLGEWKGVLTDDRRVVVLYLGDNGLTGEIPPELGSLSNLTALYLDTNALSGEIPPELGSLSNLTDLSLYHNAFKRGDTGGAGQPLQPGRAGPPQQRVKRGDTGGAGQPLQPDKSAPPLQRLERVCAKQPGRPVYLL